MKAHADNSTKRRWFRAWTDLASRNQRRAVNFATSGIFFFSVILVLPVKPAYCAAVPHTSYEVIGHGEKAGVGYSSRWKFKVLINGCRWAITVSDITQRQSDPSASNIQPDYITATHDGEQYYHLTSYATATAAITNASHSAEALVAPDWDPVLSTRELKALWWLYASHCVLVTNTDEHLPMLDIVTPEMYRRDARFRPGQLKRLGGLPGLPRVVQMGRSPEEMLAHGEPLNSEGRALKGERLEVSETIDLGGLILPKSSRVDYFLSLSPTQPWFSISIHAEEVRAVTTRDSYQPKIQERTSVDSAHFWKSDPPQLAWIITNKWPEPHEFRRTPIRP